MYKIIRINLSWFVFVWVGVLVIFSCNNAQPEAVASNESESVNIPADSSGKSKEMNESEKINGNIAPGSDNPATSFLIREFLVTKYSDDLEKNMIDSFSRQFIFQETDLNSDGINEIFVGTFGSYFCGSGGCSVMLLNNKGSLISEFTVVDYPIVISNVSTNEWKDIYMLSSGNYHVMKFKGGKYPSNPSVQTKLNALPSDDLQRILAIDLYNYSRFTF